MLKKRPNFVIFLTDQHRADLLGCAGHPVLRTPHIDSIAERGVRFDRFYVANPVCMPNRASLMTGRPSSVHGVRSNGLPLPMDEVTFVELLRDAGYDTVLVGKSHLQNNTGLPPKLEWPPAPATHRAPAPELAQSRRDHLDSPLYNQEGRRDWDDPDTRVTLPFYGFGQVELATGHGDLVEGNYMAWVRSKGADVRALRGPQHALPHENSCPQAWRTAMPEELYPSAYVAEKSCEVIERLSQQQDKPFFCWCLSLIRTTRSRHPAATGTCTALKTCRPSLPTPTPTGPCHRMCRPCWTSVKGAVRSLVASGPSLSASKRHARHTR